MKSSNFMQSFLMALMIVAVGMIAFGVYRFVDISNQLDDNIAHQIQTNNTQINPQSTAEARGLIAADVERNELLRERFQSMMVGGGGLALLSVAIIIFDITRSRRKKETETLNTSSAMR